MTNFSTNINIIHIDSLSITILHIHTRNFMLLMKKFPQRSMFDPDVPSALETCGVCYLSFAATASMKPSVVS
jgi:hypothetical protein